MKTRRDEIYAYICHYAEKYGGPTPTIREIAQYLDISYSSTYHFINQLIERGRLGRNEDNKLTVIGALWIAPDYEKAPDDKL